LLEAGRALFLPTRRGIPRLKIIERSPPAAALGRERMFFDLYKALEASLHGGDRPPFTTRQSSANTPD
jgi:hypothetical protein